MQHRQRDRRLQQRRLRIQAQELGEVVTCLEQTIPNRMMTKHVNDVVIELQQQILALEDRNPEHIEAAIHKSELHSEEILNPQTQHQLSYQRDSDAQIAKTQLHLNEAMHVLTQQAGRGVINEVELDTYISELRWAYLMISVMSYIGQGDKSAAISDRFSAQAFYRKAQQLLMESMHQDSRRLKMIKELSEMVDGDRVDLSRDLRNPSPTPLKLH
ncbi:MAG TPA: hypothetical protein VL995_21640 [Cellvibrio sp.]|nr:hypothetical protein [Cellvibrio sp.]